MVRATDIEITRKPADPLGNAVYRATLSLTSSRSVAGAMVRDGGDEAEAWIREDLTRTILRHIYGDLAEPLQRLRRAAQAGAFDSFNDSQARREWDEAWAAVSAITTGM